MSRHSGCTYRRAGVRLCTSPPPTHCTTMRQGGSPNSDKRWPYVHGPSWSETRRFRDSARRTPLGTRRAAGPQIHLEDSGTSAQAGWAGRGAGAQDQHRALRGRCDAGAQSRPANHHRGIPCPSAMIGQRWASRHRPPEHLCAHRRGHGGAVERILPLRAAAAGA
jgi:hypothetical protein